MSDNSKIEWTDATWNPVRGCVKISPGCKHCYAETFAERFRGVPDHPFEQGFDPKLIPEQLTTPFRWTRAKTVFVNSMSDLFLESVPDDYIVDVAKVMVETGWHTYQVLTKRSGRMAKLLSDKLAFAAEATNIWWGVSVEDKRNGLPRLADLRDASAAVRFLSVEPLLEELGDLDLRGIHWVIVGGESGPGARPMEPSWVTSIRAQCRRQNTPFFFKQWGGTRKKLAGRTLEGRTYDAMPRRKASAMPSRKERVALAKRWEPLIAKWQPLVLIGRPRKKTTNLNDVITVSA